MGARGNIAAVTLCLISLVSSAGAQAPRFPGSPYVPLDSWVYRAFDRLAALGYAPVAFLGLRPWTRSECGRLVDEATELAREATRPEVDRLLTELRKEFIQDDAGATLERIQVESVYWRTLAISGPPLVDAYHFGQTVYGDYGRPFGRGGNHIAGASVIAMKGPLFFYARGEYQRAPSHPALPESARVAIGSTGHGHLVAGIPPPLATPATSRLRALDAYAGFNIRNWQLTFGQQSLWWGPGEGQALLFSNNIEPIPMLRLNRVEPFKFPGFMGRLGPVRTEMFIGRLAGHEFIVAPEGLVGSFGQPLPSQPFVHGQIIAFKPTPNLEIGFFRTTILGGSGYPMNMRALVRSLFVTSNVFAGDPRKPGDRRSGLSFSYRLPHLRDRATLYGEGFAEDEYSPVAYADRSVWRAGLYLPQVPGATKLDLRVEGVYTDNPLGGNLCCGYFYYNATWRNGYTHHKNLIGHWIGRQGQGAQAWTSYHFSPRDRLQFGFRRQKVSAQMLPGGGTLTDVGVHADWWLDSTTSLQMGIQYERWTFPVLSALPESNVAASVQLTFRPRLALPRQ